MCAHAIMPLWGCILIGIDHLIGHSIDQIQMAQIVHIEIMLYSGFFLILWVIGRFIWGLIISCIFIIGMMQNSH